MTNKQKLLYTGMWCTTVTLAFVGFLTMLVSEGCSNACDWLDAKMEKLRAPAETP